jgi:membrane dipeptidase
MRYAIPGLLSLLSALGGALGLLAEPARPGSRGPVVLTPAGQRLHADCLVIDGHNDLPWRLRELGHLDLTRIDLRQPQPRLHTDIPRLRRGGVGAQFWSAFVPCSSAQKGEAVRLTLEQIDLIHRLIRAYPETFALAQTADDIVRLHRQGRIASLIGVEGGHSIDNSLGVLRMYYTLGVRYMTLTHADNTAWADSATDKPVHNGLTPFGVQVVREMNRLGMLVDISHVSVKTMQEVLRVSQAPVIASHSSAYALAPHPRNIPDEVLRQIAHKGGLVMVNFFSGFVVPEGARALEEMFAVARQLQARYPKEAEFRQAYDQWLRQHPFPRGSIHHVVDHIEHIVRVAGIEHVGLGSDFDGVGTLPQQLEDVSAYPYLTQELLNRGYSPEAIRKILGGNLLRVLRQAEAVAHKLAGS